MLKKVVSSIISQFEFKGPEGDFPLLSGDQVVNSEYGQFVVTESGGYYQVNTRMGHPRQSCSKSDLPRH